MNPSARVSALYVYPVKSCRGVALQETAVVERGFEADRRWMVVDSRGNFLTQRQVPGLGCIKTTLTSDAIQLEAPSQPNYRLPRQLLSGESMDTQVWEYRGVSLRHPEASSWLSRVLGIECSLVYMPDQARRPVNPTHARPGDLVNFADGYPVLLISEASLTDLNQRLQVPVQMDRFRPNVVVSGVAAFGEDAWTRVRLGPLWFRAVKRCDRCVVTTVDPETGRKGVEPLRTLARYRKEAGKVWFGMNLIQEGAGTLSVGDSVEPSE